MARTAESKGREIGSKVRNRHNGETGLINTIAENDGGTWYYVTTLRGMSIGWWHETDLDLAPKSVPPSKKSAA